jgi:hypothetical protein
VVITTEEVTVLAVEAWNDDDPKMGRCLVFKEPGGTVRKWTIPTTVEDPTTGQLVSITADMTERVDAKISENGKAYIARRDKCRVRAIAA